MSCVFLQLGAMGGVPKISTADTVLTPKQLTRREDRAGRTLLVLRKSEPAYAALRARKIASRMYELAIDPAQDAKVRVDASRTMLACQDQLLDILGHPKRPACPPSKSGPTIPVSGTVLEAILSPTSIPPEEPKL